MTESKGLYKHAIPTKGPELTLGVFAMPAANQFLIPMAIALGAPITAREFVAYNLIPGELRTQAAGCQHLSK
jgi:hypothetical protein